LSLNPTDEAVWLALTRLPDPYLHLAEHLRQREGKRMLLFFRSGGAVDPRDYELPPEFGAALPDPALARLQTHAGTAHAHP
jgi:hypothetical protein